MRVKNTSIPVFLSLLTFAACGGGGGGGDATIAPPSASLSSLAADRTSAPADGATEVLLTAVVRDTAGSALAGREVRFEAVGAGVNVQPASVVALNGGIATARLTASVPGNVTVSAIVGTGGNGVRLDETVSITFVAVNAPVVAGIARYEDQDDDASVSQGDRVIVPFSSDVNVSGASAADFVLPVQDDTLGVGATVAAGPASNEVTITLGQQPRLRTRGRFAAGLTVNNEPSGIDVQNGQGITAAVGGTPASASSAIDIGPMPVAGQSVATGGEHVAIGDLSGNGVQDVLVANGTSLQALVNSNGTLSVSTSVGSAAVRDLDVANLNRIGSEEALTAESTGVRVWNNTAVGGSPPALAQAQNIPVGDTFAVMALDVDADGFPDAVAGTANGVTVARHQRNLGNSYIIAQSIASATPVVGLRAVDIDGDGDLDVLAARGTGGVLVLRNDAGLLVVDSQIDADGAESVAAGDIDGDGLVDLVVAGQLPVTVLRNTGAGFTPEALGFTASQVELVDVDGDAFPDLVLRSAAGLEVQLNDRSGAFSALGTTATTGVLDVAVVDLDRDGDDDFVAVDAAATELFEGSLAGSFGDALFAATADLGVDAVGAQELADVNRDGRVDRIVATANGAQVWFGDGIGSFAVGATFGSAAPVVIALGDLDGDLDLDCVLGFDGANEVYTNDGNGTFTFAVTFAPASDTRSFGLTDFDGDGDLDVFVGNNGTNQLFLNDGALTLTENAAAFLNLLPQALGNETIAVLVLDFDREGDEDIILINGGDITSPQNAYVLRRSGTGYTLLNTLNAQLLATSATIGDVDGDGRDDLAIAQLSPGGNASVKWFRGLATSIATLSTNVATNGQYFSRSLVIGDVDGDGRNDFVVGDVSVSNQPIAVLRQLPNGDFQIGQEFPTTRLERVAAGDFDRDGDLDLVTVETTGPSRVLTNR